MTLLPSVLGAASDTRLAAATEGNKVVLVWNYSPLYQGYNIYRKEPGGKFRKLNVTPITMITSCRQIRRIISPGTPEWEKLQKMHIDPCKLPDTLRSDTLLAKIMRTYSLSTYRLAVVLGLGYVDSRLPVGKTYIYGITGIIRGGETQILDTAQVTVGHPVLPAAPTGIEGYPGDNSVLIRWNPVPNATGYVVERRDMTGGYVRVNEAVLMSNCKTTPFGDTLSDTTKLCFTDYLRWHNSEPDSHLVDGHWIKGPFNGVTYTYRVRAINPLHQQGSASSGVSVTPVDSTPPRAPNDIHVSAIGESLLVAWEKIELDVVGHRELQGIKHYLVYRYTSAEDTIGTFVGTVPQPGSNTMQVSILDRGPGLGSPYEDKVYYYRIVTVDNSNNRSVYSAPVSGVIKDVTPPDPPVNLKAEGYTDYIKLNWEKPMAPDVAGYVILRGICGDTLIMQREKRVIYPLHIIASIDNPDSVEFEDHGVPQGSPLCYRYAVKAVDKSQNISDTSNTVCEKLREKVPPPPPVIVGLKARNKGILVEWVSAPVQDLFGFIVERAESTSTTWKQVSPKLHFPEKPTCKDIAENSIWAKDTVYSFLDTSVVSKVVYRYRVRGADFNGNVGEPSAEVSTYTFDFTVPEKPWITSITATATGLRLAWEPTYSSSRHEGFIVFRSTSSAGEYHQISGLIKGNYFTDKNVAHGKKFWYKIQLIDVQGNRSEPSNPKSGTMP